MLSSSTDILCSGFTIIRNYSHTQKNIMIILITTRWNRSDIANVDYKRQTKQITKASEQANLSGENMWKTEDDIVDEKNW